MAKLISYERSYWRLFQIREKFEDIKVVNWRSDNAKTSRRKTDNTKTSRRKTDGQIMIYKPLHIIIKNEQHAPNLILGCSVRVIHSCSTSGICHVTLVTNPVTSHEWKKRPDCNFDKKSIIVVICDTDIP